MILKDEWEWYGYATHFCGGRDCAFHLSTRIGKYLVSTIGDYRPHSEEKAKRLNLQDDLFETKVFPCDGEDEDGNPNVLEWTGIDSRGYKNSKKAEDGHKLMCAKYAKKSKKVVQEQPSQTNTQETDSGYKELFDILAKGKGEGKP